MPREHLTLMERTKIQIYLEQGHGRSAIAQQLGRDLSTIVREVARNTTARGYDAQRAHGLYRERRKACQPARKLENPALRAYVVEKINEEEWTPEQVAGRLPIEYPDDPHMRISHEAIYQALYTQDQFHYLIAALPQGRPKRRPRGQGKHRRGPTIPNCVGIAKRPEEANTREHVGHWEGDTVVGKGATGYIVTVVERTSRLLHAIKTQTKRANEVAQAIIESLLERPHSWLKTVTFDNGTEFTNHEHIAQQLGVDIYFADPYSSYQRGTNENTNGLIRRYLPKGKSFKDLTQRQLDNIVNQINNRPRKCLGFKTANEVFNETRQQRLLALGT